MPVREMRLQAGSYGYDVQFPTAMNLAGITSLYLVVHPMGQPSWEREVAIPDDIDVTNRTVTWHVLSGDIPVVGAYRLQLSNRTNGANDLSEVVEFWVAPNA